MAETIRTHRQGVLRWFTSHISNGVLEGITSLIQATKAKARGRRNVDNLITMSYLIAGQLRFKCSPFQIARSPKRSRPPQSMAMTHLRRGVP